MQSISLKYVMVRYLFLLAATEISLITLFEILKTQLGYSAPFTTITILCPAVIALDAGYTIYRKWHIRLRGSKLWILSLILSLENFAFNGVLMAAVLLIRYDNYAQFSSAFYLILFVGMLTQAVIGFFLIRILLSIGQWWAEKVRLKQMKEVF